MQIWYVYSFRYFCYQSFHHRGLKETGKIYTNAVFLRTLGKFNNLCTVSLATGGLVSALQPLCSLRQSLQGSLFAVCRVYINNPQHSQKQTYGSPYCGPYHCVDGCKRKFHMSFQVACAPGWRLQKY